MKKTNWQSPEAKMRIYFSVHASCFDRFEIKTSSEEVDSNATLKLLDPRK